MSLPWPHLLLDLGGVLVADDVLEGVAGDQGEPGVALGGLLAGLHDHARRFEFDQGVVGVGLVDRDVDDQPGWLEVVQQRVDLTPQLEEAAVVAGDGRAGDVETLGDGPVVRTGVVPDDEGVFLDLLGDQAGPDVR